MAQGGLLAQSTSLRFTLAHLCREGKNMSHLSMVLVVEGVQSSRALDLLPSCSQSEDMIKASCHPPLERWEETADWLSA